MRILKTTRQMMERTTFALGLTLIASGMLAGCGTGAGMGSGSTTVPGVALHGNVHGGQQPINGAILQLYAAGSGGYGSAATPLISSVVKTDPSGNFSIGGDFTCTSGSQLIYLTATQGDAGAGNNPNLALMVALGPCSDLASFSFVWINEVTTVASVWALSPFMTGLANVGAPTSNITGLTNAFADVNTLVDVTNGESPGPGLPAGTEVPSSEMYTLANILATCINSSGGSAVTPTTNCGKLFSLVKPSTGGAPSDTVVAALDIAQHPGFNVGALYALPPPAGAAFPSGLMLLPNDFTIAVNFTSGGISAPAALAADASGNVWIANGTGAAVTELSHSGVPVAGSPFAASLSGASAIAIDALGGPWITNKTGNSVSRLTSAGSVVAGSPYAPNGIFMAPTGIAFDLSGKAWISNSGDNSLSTLDSTGSAQHFNPSGVNAPVGIGVDPR